MSLLEQLGLTNEEGITPLGMGAAVGGGALGLGALMPLAGKGIARMMGPLPPNPMAGQLQEALAQVAALQARPPQHLLHPVVVPPGMVDLPDVIAQVLQKNQGMTVDQLYDAVEAVYPKITVGQFADALEVMRQQSMVQTAFDPLEAMAAQQVRGAAPDAFGQFVSDTQPFGPNPWQRAADVLYGQAPDVKQLSPGVYLNPGHVVGEGFGTGGREVLMGDLPLRS